MQADWNETSSLKSLPYYYSKTVAEKFAWEEAKVRPTMMWMVHCH